MTAVTLLAGSRWRPMLDAAVTGPLLHAPVRTLLAVLAIALGVALGFAVYLINRVASDEVRLAASSLFGTADLSVLAPGAGIDESWYPRLAAIDGVAIASPVVIVSARIAGRETAIELIGIDAFRARQLQPAIVRDARPTLVAGSAVSLLVDDAVWLSPAAANSLGLAPGDTLVTRVGLDEVGLRVSGLFPSGDHRGSFGLLDIATAQWRFGRLGRLDRVDLRLRPGAAIDDVRNGIADLLPPGAQIRTPGEAGDDAVRLTRAYRSNLTALALVALFTGGFLVYATQSLSVAHRRRQIALLHALGMTTKQQLLLSLFSGALVGIAGAVVGVLLGYFVAWFGLTHFGADLGAGYFRGVIPQLRVHALEWVVFSVFGICAALIATIGPAREAARVPAAAALKAGDAVESEKRTPWWPAAALFIAGCVLVRLPPVTGLPLPGYAAIACLLIAAVLVTPHVSRWLLLRVPVTGPAWRQVALAHLRGTVARSSVSIAAVLVSFSLMVAMAIMVTSFRHSLEAWLERVLPADLYVRAGPSSQTAFLDVDAQQTLAQLEGVRQTDFIRYADVVLPGGSPLTLIARSIDDASAAGKLSLRRVGSAAVPADASPVWVSEAALDLHGMKVDCSFELPIAGHTVRAFVRGVWRDYEQRSGGAIVMSRDRYVGLTGDTRVATAALWLDDGTSTTEVADRVRAAIDRNGALMIAEPAQIRRMSLQTFDRTFAVTYLLEAVAVLIGLFGIAASTSTQVLARRAEFGMLRHIGATRREIASMLAFEGGVVGALGATIGLVVGTVIGLILIYVVNRQSFHWSMDLHLPWALLAVLSVVLVAAAALTSAVSGRSAMGSDVVQAVKEDW